MSSGSESESGSGAGSESPGGSRGEASSGAGSEESRFELHPEGGAVGASSSSRDAHGEEPPVVERIMHLTREQVDDLPYGFMIFDRAGTVLLYNRYESRMSRRAPEDVVGRSWFREIAPCTRVQAFEGRFASFVERAVRDEVVNFEFRFHFLHGAQDVTVHLSHAPQGDDVFVAVARRALSESGARLDVTHPTETLDDGRARGGLGSVLPAPRIFFAAAFDDIDEPDARARLARGASAWGRALLAAIEANVERVHGSALVRLPAPLAIASVDTAIAAQGLGRVDFDFGGRARGVVGVVVRPADLPANLADVLYRAILEEVCLALTGRPVAAVEFGRLGDVLRFAVTTAQKAAIVARWCGEGMEADAIARRLALETWNDDAAPPVDVAPRLETPGPDEPLSDRLAAFDWDAPLDDPSARSPAR